MFDPQYDRFQRLHRILARPVDVRRVHIDPESFGWDGFHQAQGRGGIVDAGSHVGFGA